MGGVGGGEFGRDFVRCNRTGVSATQDALKLD